MYKDATCNRFEYSDGALIYSQSPGTTFTLRCHLSINNTATEEIAVA